MTDLGAADRVYVCGPDCKAIKQGDSAESSGRWEDFRYYTLWTIIGTLAAIGGGDIVLRILLDFWLF